LEDEQMTDNAGKQAGRWSRRSIIKGAAGASAAAIALKSSGALAAGGSAPALLRFGRQSNTEIIFSHIWGTPPGEEAAAKKHPVELLIDAYNAKGTGVTVVSRTDSTDYFVNLQKAQAELAAGNPPAMVATPWSYINFAVQGLGVDDLEDVSAAAGGTIDDIVANLKPEVLPLVQVDGKMKGVPFAFSTSVLYTNDDLLAAAGVDGADLLATWPGLLEKAGPVKDSNGGNPVIGFSTNRDWPAQGIIQSNGGRVVNDEGELAFESEEAQAALQAIADLNDAGFYFKSIPKEVRPAFIAGSLPIMQGSIAALGGVTTDATFKFSVHSFPKFPDKQRLMNSGGSFIGVYARDDDQKKATWDFIKFVISQEGMEIWMKTGYLNSTTFEIPQLPGQEAAYEQLNEGITRETAWPGSRGAEMQHVWEESCDQMFAGDVSVADGVKQAKEEMSDLM
jgi:multiple sugar transport system substrate-binding protein